jgi:preprotein translocase subunit SecE
MDTKTATAKVPSFAPVNFVREVIAELKKVNWPTRAETIKLTVLVIAISLIMGIFISGVDAFFVKATTILYQR